jgi:eukaryotic-like serine/threonine-protein kinase
MSEGSPPCPLAIFVLIFPSLAGGGPRAMNDEICTETAPLKVGEEFVRYQIRSLIGHGDHAHVYDAYDPFLEREVAIKVIPDPPNSQRDLVQRALEQEAILRDLRHPNLVSVFEVGTIGDNLVYVVMERVKGQPLRQLLLERQLLTPLEVANIGLQVAEAMSFAHSQMVIHRDIKPENIFILPSGEVKVINTGITSFIVPSGMVTERDRLRGTLLYMSPEHIQGFGVTDSCDMYSLGTVLYECLAGMPPVLIGSENLTLDDVVWRQVAHMPPQLDDLVPNMPKLLARTVQQMLAKEAVLRFATMDAAAARLREARRRISTGVGTDSPDSEPEKPNDDFKATVVALDDAVATGKVSNPDLALITAQAIAKRAAELDEGVNSRCPPAMGSVQNLRKPKNRRTLVVASILLGSLLGLAIAIFKARSGEGHSTPTRAASGPLPQSRTASGPGSTTERFSETKTFSKSDTYIAQQAPPVPSASMTQRPMIKPDKLKAGKGKAKNASTGDLIF